MMKTKNITIAKKSLELVPNRRLLNNHSYMQCLITLIEILYTDKIHEIILE